MNIFKQTKDDIIKALEEMLPEVTDVSSVTAEPPRDSNHGDISTNAAMVVAKQAGKNPRDVALELSEKLRSLPYIDEVDVAGPGFINIKITNQRWLEVLNEVMESNLDYGNCDLGQNKPINIEFVSANPTGPMHIGHARGAVYGDALARLLEKAGYNVTKEYYINDSGAQIKKLVQSVFLRFKEALGEEIGEMPDDLYPGKYLIPVGQTFAERYGGDSFDLKKESHEKEMRVFTLNYMMTLIRNDLKLLGIEHDVFTSEKKLIEKNKVEEALELLDKKGLVYKGVLEPPKGKKLDDWEPREQTLFKATAFGDDVDRPLKKSDGTNTYFSSDIAYHYDKIERGFKNMVLVLGADHGGYQKRLKAAVKALGDGDTDLEIKIYQLVNFLEGGKPAKMSKRSGNFLTVKDVVNAVGKDVIRFIMLTRKNDAVLDFDFKVVTEQSRDNPVFYVQYAHARSHSVLRNAKTEMPELKEMATKDNEEVISRLDREEEIELIKHIAQWPRIVETAALHCEPHRIVFYLQELAGVFHALWNKGKEDDSLRFIVNDDIMLTKARLILIKAFATTIASGLHVIGVEPVMEM